jgi:hypothetical protein
VRASRDEAFWDKAHFNMVILQCFTASFNSRFKDLPVEDVECIPRNELIFDDANLLRSLRHESLEVTVSSRPNEVVILQFT